MKNYLQQTALKKKTIFFGVFILLAGTFPMHLFAQNSDTTSMYYLLDTAKTPKNDRMWLIHPEGVYTFYYINCPCIEENQRPYLYSKKPTTHFRISIALYDLIRHLKARYLSPQKLPTYIYIVQPMDGDFEATKVRLWIKDRGAIVN
jgi:hypothetical protein